MNEIQQVDIQNKHSVLLSMHYLPNLEYFAAIGSFDTIIIEGAEHYARQTFRNRCQVLTANKVDTLSIPVEKREGKMLIRDVKIDYQQDWLRRHWGCLQSAYAKSPYFEFYAPDIKAVFDKKPVFLFDLNERLLTLCLSFLKLKKEITYNMSYQENLESGVFDARNSFLDKKQFENTAFYKKNVYYQTFGNDFIGNLSVVDLLFNSGPLALSVLKQSSPNWK